MGQQYHSGYQICLGMHTVVALSGYHPYMSLLLQALTIGIPPGYGFSLKPGESTPIYSLTIAPKPTYPTASGGYVVLSSGSFGTSSTGIGQQLTLTSVGNGSYAVPTVPAVFQGTATRLSMMMTAVVGTLLLGLTLL